MKRMTLGLLVGLVLGSATLLWSVGATPFAIIDLTTGIRIGGAAASGKYLRGDGTNFVSGDLDVGDAAAGTLAVARGGTNLGAAADDNVMVGNGTTWETKAIPDCANATTSKLLYEATSNTFSCGTDQSGSGGGYGTIEDEDTPLTQRTTLNFAGAGVTCADDTSQTTCTIPGSNTLYVRGGTAASLFSTTVVQAFDIWSRSGLAGATDSGGIETLAAIVPTGKTFTYANGRCFRGGESLASGNYTIEIINSSNSVIGTFSCVLGSAANFCTSTGSSTVTAGTVHAFRSTPNSPNVQVRAVCITEVTVADS